MSIEPIPLTKSQLKEIAVATLKAVETLPSNWYEKSFNVRLSFDGRYYLRADFSAMCVYSEEK